MNKNRGEERRIVQPGTIASHLHLQQTSHQVSSSSPACNYNYPVTVAPTAIAGLVTGWATDHAWLSGSNPACTDMLDLI